MTKKRLIILFSITVVAMLLLNSLTLFNYLKNNFFVKPEGTVLGWGDNSYFQLGEFAENDSLTTQNPRTIPAKNVTKLTTGYGFNMFLEEGGKVELMGDNRAGQIGDGTPVINREKLSTPTGLDSNVVDIAAGAHHALAVDKDGNVWSWGNNMSGQIGNNTNDNQLAPYKLPDLHNIVKVAAGFRTSFALDKDGNVWGWGGSCSENNKILYNSLLDKSAQNSSVNLGYYSRGSEDPRLANNLNDCVSESEDNMNIKSKVPKKIDGISNVTQISAGYGTFMALTKNGEVWSWGCNKYGQVGNGNNTNNVDIQTPKKVNGLPTITQISAGFRHSLVLDKDGKVWSWGHNAFGELGIGNADDTYNPTKISMSQKISSVHAGFDYSVIIDEQGKMYGFGEDEDQQIRTFNDKTTKTPHQFSTPVEITQPKRAFQVGLGGEFIIVLI